MLDKDKRNKYTQEYNKQKYDTTTLRLPKGGLKSVQEHAREAGYSFNDFVNKAINEAIGNGMKKTEPDNAHIIVKTWRG